MGTMYQVDQTTGEPSTPVLGGGGAASGGGLTQEEHDALMSFASLPARADYNPNKQTPSTYNRNPSVYNMALIADGSTSYSCIPCIGYAKLAFYYVSTANIVSVHWGRSDGSIDSESAFDITRNTWSNYVDIPQDAICLVAKGTLSGTTGAAFPCTVSMLTADSPYNPDNQTP